MANPIDLIITNAGLDALVDAQNGNTDAVKVIEIGLTEAAFDPAPTLTALPGEFKRLASVAGQSTGPDTIHMTALDASAATYDLRGIGLFLEDGTLFASFGQADPIFSKVTIASFLLAFDVRFSGNIAQDIALGDATFLYPPATETVKGVAEIASDEEVAAGADDERIVSPAKLAVRLLPILAAIADETTTREAADNALQGLIDTLQARSITGTGLATGSGTLGAGNIAIAVAAALQADVLAGEALDKAITPAALGPIIKSLGQSGYISIPTANPARLVVLQWGRFVAPSNSTSTIAFPLAYSAPAWSVVTDGTSDTNANAQDNYPAVRSSQITATGFGVFNANETGDACCFFAIGEVNAA